MSGLVLLRGAAPWLHKVEFRSPACQPAPLLNLQATWQRPARRRFFVPRPAATGFRVLVPLLARAAILTGGWRASVRSRPFSTLLPALSSGLLPSLPASAESRHAIEQRPARSEPIWPSGRVFRFRTV